MKFGGSSVKDPEAVRRVVEVVGREKRPRLVVVSALAGVTDGLLEIARLVENGEGDAAQEAVRGLRKRHEEMAVLAREPDKKARLMASIDALFDQLEAIVKALAVVEEVSPRSRDTIQSFGEITSSHIVAAALEEAGIAARSVDPRTILVTDAQHMAAQPDLEATDERLRSQVAPLLADGIVPVVGGFLGASPGGLTTTLGRGGSDYSAALFGAGLDAEEIQIWTDVDGMLTADPRVVSRSRVVPHLSFDEASELAYFGAKVLHPSTIAPAVRRDIPVRILNSHRPEAPGTRITRESADSVSGPAAIACKRGLTRPRHRLHPHAHGLRVSPASVRGVRALQDPGGRRDHLGGERFGDDRRQEQPRRDRDRPVGVRRGLERGRHGDRMRSRRGSPADASLATHLIGALEGVPLMMVSQGGSRKNITVVLRDGDVVVAMERLHRRFFEAEDVPAGTAAHTA